MTTIPTSHQDLLEEANPLTLATVAKDGTPQSTVLWYLWDGDQFLLSTTRSRQKTENIEANPNVSLLIIDPNNMYRYLEVRGTVSVSEEGGYELIDQLAKRYTGKDHYYGDIQPAERKAKEDRIILQIKPEHVVARG